MGSGFTAEAQRTRRDGPGGAGPYREFVKVNGERKIFTPGDQVGRALRTRLVRG